MDTKAFLGTLDDARIVAAIRAAEMRSSAEVRVHVSDQDVADVEAAAARQFESLGMTGTAGRNGVLVYVAPRSQKFAVLGDTAIHDCCGPDFWKDVASAMEQDFRAGRFCDGIIRGVTRLGDVLATHFPRPSGRADVNELPDHVSRD
jgi:uncharacterized membrane protein